MFSNLSGWMQYLYVTFFMLICGYSVPYLGGFNIFALSLAAGSGALVLTQSSWIDRIITNHQFISFFIPLIFLLLLGALVACFWLVGMALGMSTVPDRSSNRMFNILFICAALLLIIFPVYIPFHVIGVKGWLLAAATAAFAGGVALGLFSLLLVQNHFNRYFLQLLSCIVLSAGVYFMITKPAPSGLIWIGVFILIASFITLFGFKNEIISTFHEKCLINDIIKMKRPVDKKTQEWLNMKLCHALTWGSMREVNKLIDAGADINQFNYGYGSTPLSCALSYGGWDSYWSKRKQRKIYDERFRRAKFLIASGADVNAVDVPLIKAMDNEQLFKFLLDAGADPNIKNKHGETVFDFSKENPEIKNLLQKYKK